MSGQDRESQSYLARLSPWSRSPIVQPSQGKDGEPEPLLKQQKGTDHIVSRRNRLGLRDYPRDCPPLRPQWFHAVDSPKRRPNPAGKTEERTLPAPKKYTAFSIRDSKTIESSYRKLAEDQNTTEFDHHFNDISLKQKDNESNDKRRGSESGDLKTGKLKVPVNEDYLFEVDVEKRELGPAYWPGPIYDVRRGTWFYQDGNAQRPCDENLATQLEDGYLKVKAWKLPPTETGKPRSSSQPRVRPTSWTPGQSLNDESKLPASAPLTPKGSNTDLRKQATEARQIEHDNEPGIEHPEPLQNSYRLFGAHMNSIVTYQDATTAWLSTDDFMARANYAMYQRFAGGGHLGGTKLTRGYVSPTKRTEKRSEKAEDGKETEVTEKDDGDDETVQSTVEDSSQQQSPSESRRQKLERQMSSLLGDGSGEDRAKQEEEVRKRDEREMEEDYRENEDEVQDREIEHLILVTHGIGQRLGLRIEAVNFVHDVNTLRKTIKAVYADSPDLKALNAELGNTDSVNSRIQVLPICWRHKLDFPKQSLRHNRKEHDIADTDFDDEEYPSLEDISVEGVPAVRNLITDLALDILLYQSPAYKDHISRIVLEECNRIYHLFMERNPNFKGKVSFIGHSLGSAIMFDLLCRQDQQVEASKRRRKDQDHLKLDFDVEDFYALGSPIGLFQMLTGQTIVARDSAERRKRGLSNSTDDPMLDMAPQVVKKGRNTLERSPTTDMMTSSPKCAQVFNIFHPTDPISYRVEPLISPAMASLKPQPLPYTKRGILGFGAPVGKGLTGVGARVSQSVSSMWSSVASSLLTRGLGYSGGETALLAGTQSATKSGGPLSIAVPPTAPLPAEGVEIAKVNDTNADEVADDTDPRPQSGHHPPTLIDAELQTLYAGFQTRRKSVQDNDADQRDLGAGAIGSREWEEAEERAKRFKREEEKVRRLNGNGRVDYAIQEGAFDINLIAAIASHLSYWGDEDVSHFIVSQLLSRHRVVRRRAGSEPRG